MIFQGIVQATLNLGVQNMPHFTVYLYKNNSLVRQSWPLLEYKGSFRSQFNGYGFPYTI